MKTTKKINGITVKAYVHKMLAFEPAFEDSDLWLAWVQEYLDNKPRKPCKPGHKYISND